MKTIAPYGEWRSPVTSELVAAGHMRLAQPTLCGKGIYWLETRSTEQGRNTLMRAEPASEPTELTASPFNVRTRAHEYGGGAYLIADERAWFVNDADQCIYELRFQNEPRHEPRRLTEPDELRFADLILDVRHDRLIAIAEDHGHRGQPKNSLVAISLADGDVAVLAEGFDFFSSPTLTSGGDRIAWIAWVHPNLPWNVTELWVADVDPDGQCRHARQVAGSPPASLQQPRWGPDGRLYFVSDGSGWWNIWRWNGEQVEPFTDMQAEFGLPQWNFGISTYGFIDDTTMVCAMKRGGFWELARVDIKSKALSPIQMEFDAIEHLEAAQGHAVMLVGSPSQPSSIVSLSARPDSIRPDPIRPRGFEVIRRSTPQMIDDGYISIPRRIEFPTGDGETAHAWLYLPANQDYSAPPEERPPLLVKSHGGPTSSASTILNPRVQYWTSRGVAVVDVDYRGSTGFGRDYREKIYGQWGVADVEDCINAARHVCERGLADPRRTMISGSSAGGFSVLCALTFHDFFTAGASHYGVADLTSLFSDTHKFESRYDHWLLGPRPDSEMLYHDRSPINFVEQIDCPVILFQGLEDKVVPPNQAEQIVATLRRRGLPVSYIAFADEGHGFRRAENIKRALEAELAFYGRIVGFEPADELPEIEIENFKGASMN